MSALASLHHLLCQTFDVQSLRRFVRLGEQGDAISARLPSGNVPLTEIVDALIEHLRQRGLIQVTLFRLQREFPRRSAEIEQVAAMWSEAPSVPSLNRADDRSAAPLVAPGRSGHEHSQTRKMLASRILAHVDIPATLEVSLGERYTELEAEVEVEAEVPTSRTSRSWLRPWTRAGQLRLEPSLVQAIERCSDEIILLEGEPGSGKTVSLHRVERSFAQQIRRTPECQLPLPLCVKLKYLTASERSPREQLIVCILRSIDADVSVARDLFGQGIRCGGWILLLDGFDEIPGVLSAIALDENVRAYALAIHDLYTELNGEREGACRIVVATRHYHGPKGIWRSIFRLRPLSTARRLQFIRNFRLTDRQVNDIVDHLATAPVEVQRWADNPLTLAMLCEVVQTGQSPPENLYGLFERYLALRFGRDAGRLRELYTGSLAQLRRSAEDIGFVMSAEPGLGLAPSTAAIRTALEQHGLRAKDLEATLEAIDRIDLVIREERGEELFTGFRHRRLQEYFATCVLLREPDRVSPESLLFDARWREATVVLLQQGDAPVLAPLFERIEEYLTECCETMGVSLSLGESDTEWELDSEYPSKIAWPDRLYHLLGLMQAGFAYRPDLPVEIQNLVLSILYHVYGNGIRMDKKYVLEVVGVLPSTFVEAFALSAFSSKSELLQDAAFQQIPRMGKPSLVIRHHVSRLLVRMARSGKLVEDHLATRARIRRTNSRKLEILFEMANAAATVDRAIRIAFLFIYILLLLGLVAVAGAPAWSASIVGIIVLVSSLAALFIRDLSSKSPLFVRIVLDGITLLFVIIPAAVGLKSLGFGPVWLFVPLVFWLYSHAWSFFMLVAVHHKLAVGSRCWSVILPRLVVALLSLQGSFIKIVVPVALMVLSFWLLSDASPEPPDALMVVLLIAMGVFISGMVGVIGRQAYRHGADWINERRQRRGDHQRTFPMLCASLEALRTASARVRLLRDLLSGRRISLTMDSSTYDELAGFLVALERHVKAIESAENGGLSLLFAARIRFSDEYRAACLSEHQRWCLKNCAHAESAEALHDMIDLLTRLLERAEQVIGGPRDEGLAL